MPERARQQPLELHARWRLKSKLRQLPETLSAEIGRLVDLKMAPDILRGSGLRGIGRHRSIWTPPAGLRGTEMTCAGTVPSDEQPAVVELALELLRSNQISLRIQ